MDNFVFENQARYFAKKLNLPTHSYLDILGKEHDYFFVVAGAHRNEVLSAFRQAVDDAIEQGETLEAFRQRFDEIVAKTGWQYQGGRNWRTRIIYDTNVYASYNRGRLEQHLELAEVLPYWEYQHNDNAHPRQEHIDLDGTILPATDPFWRYYYPIKAYGCHCTVVAHDEADLKAMGKTLSASPPIEYVDKRVGVRSGNPRWVSVPKGYDVGFSPYDFNQLTASRDADIDKVLMQKLVSSEPRFADLLLRDVLKTTSATAMLNQSMQTMVQQVATEKVARGQLKYVGTLPHQVTERLTTLEKTPQTAVIAVRDQDILHALRESKQAKQLSLPETFWYNLPEKLQQPKAILLQTDRSGKDNLLYIFETEQGKVAVKLDYEVKLKDPLSGKKLTHKLNLVRTGSIINSDLDWINLKKSYQLLWGSLD